LEWIFSVKKIFNFHAKNTYFSILVIPDIDRRSTILHVAYSIELFYFVGQKLIFHLFCCFITEDLPAAILSAFFVSCGRAIWTAGKNNYSPLIIGPLSYFGWFLKIICLCPKKCDIMIYKLRTDVCFFI